ncbi:phosphoglucomutase, putative [Eimeria acervulina]|uniref:Phosphoglucomutase, putative n=1 Tax=Eimeria acervulina TaxID=5801 RepID=U6GDZ3_EIMAC|nr:phosphoglucomutase, putative [Eimeria acervulina]CDI77757.1 phosphoglucomutase, putative [Eimeria acervulina]
MDVEADLSRLRDAAVQQQIRLWLALDKNAQSQQEAKRLIKEASEEQLKEVFCKHLKFGTAGLRAHMGAGFSRLNDVTIQQASQGLADYLIKRHGADICSTRGIIIGRDCRHNSERFSHLAAATFLSRGFRVYLCRSAVHTPLVAFGVLHLNCVAGIVITASHNPKEYNGYKVYDENGAQIIPPVDADIANAIQNNQSLWPEVEEVFDRSKGFIFVSEDKAQQLVDPTKELTEEYLSSITADLCMRKEETQKSSLKVVYTPMHGGLGVGVKCTRTSVDEQCIPDPDFSTVSFPNPEEEGALNLAIKKAEENNISFVVANDPDADRLGCAEKVNGEWHQFTGDEIGIMLAAYLLEVRVKQKKEKAKMLFISSVVSSSMLKAFAEANGCVYRCTGTGFKWIENRAALLQQQQSLEPVLLYEEALGFGVYAQTEAIYTISCSSSSSSTASFFLVMLA